MPAVSPKPQGTAASQGTAAPQVTAAASRKPVGTLTVATPTIGNPGFVPARLDSTVAIMTLATFGESLIERKQDRSLGPRLARSWTVSPDGLTYTFDLRTDVKWHDGTPFTSEDVKFTFEQVIREGSVNVRFAQWRGNLDRMETPSPDRFIMRLKKPDFSAIFGVAAPGPATQSIFSKTHFTTLGEDGAAAKPIGTGPWRFVEYKASELIRATAIEGQWRKTPYFQELVIRQVPEEATRLAMVLRGEADLAQVGLSATKQLTDAGMNLFVQPNAYALIISLQGQYLPTRAKFSKAVPWAADPADATAWERARKVREALDISIDRKAIVSTILAGMAVPAAYPYAVPGSSFEDASLKVPTFDVSRAKQLLADAGYASGFDMNLLLVEASGRPLGPEVGQAVAQYWQAIGVRVKQSRADFTATVRAGTIDRSLAGSAFTFGLFTYDEPVVGHIGNFSSGADTLLGAEYAPLDDLIQKANGTPDNEARRKIQIDMGKMVLDQHFMIGIAWVHSLIAGGKRVKTIPQVSGVTGLHNFEYASSE